MSRHSLRTFFVLLLTIPLLTTIAEDSPKSLVAHSGGEESGIQNYSTDIDIFEPKIYQMHVKSNVRNRYAHTTVISRVLNVASVSQEATFSVVLPETAFISGFIMEVSGKNYTAYVAEKEQAKKVYDQAVARGSGAAHVAVSARDSNRFTVSVNVEPETKAAFYLTYEELLKRQDGHYELVINLHPGQPVKDLSAEVVIVESRKITDLKTPPIRSGNEIGNENKELDPRVKWGIANDTSAVVMFTPNIKRQKQLAHLLNTYENEGLSGQFVVQYDVERDPHGGEVLIRDGYFVHFFAPSDLKPLPKHVVFVLDTSGSMVGTKIKQLKEAMHKILEQLHENDLFHLAEFSGKTKVWNLDNPTESVWYSNEQHLDDGNFPRAYLANSENIKKAVAIISKLKDDGGTNIYTALSVALYLTKLTQAEKTDSINRQPIILFLTDGQPTIGITSTETIINDITELNSNSGPGKSSIFSLSFGDGADKAFLQKLSLLNAGFPKHIYEAADASLQLQSFYKQISSPLLANVTFKYEPSITNLTDTEFPIYFEGSELVVAGWFGKDDLSVTIPTVSAWDGHKYTLLESKVQRSDSSLERLWAYLTIKQILAKMEAASENKVKDELKKKALDLALKYSFVTPVSSLVVVKPDVLSAVDTEVAKRGYRDFNFKSYNPPSVGRGDYSDINFNYPVAGVNSGSFNFQFGNIALIIIFGIEVVLGVML